MRCSGRRPRNAEEIRTETACPHEPLRSTTLCPQPRCTRSESPILPMSLVMNHEPENRESS